MYRRYIVVVEGDTGPEILGPFTKAKAKEMVRDLERGDDFSDQKVHAVMYQLYRVYK